MAQNLKVPICMKNNSVIIPKNEPMAGTRIVKLLLSDKITRKFVFLQFMAEEFVSFNFLSIKGVFMKKIIVAFLFLSLFVCSPLYAEDTTLAPGWTIGTLDNDLGVANHLWKNHGYMTGENVEVSDGTVKIWVDEDGSLDTRGNFLPSEAGGIVYSLDNYDQLVGTTFEVELELPTSFPEYKDGVGVAQTVGIFEKNPVRWRKLKGAMVNFGYCPGGDLLERMPTFIPLAGHHVSFGNKGEHIQKPIQADMKLSVLTPDMIRQTVVVRMEVKSDSIEFSYNDDAPYYIHPTTPGEAAGEDYELRIMTHSAHVKFGQYTPREEPYVTVVKSVKINGKEIALTSN